MATYSSSARRASALALPLHDPAAFVPRREAFPPKRSLLDRLLAAMTAARQRDAEREVARYLETTGGKFTDQVEREVERRLLPDASRPL